MYDTGDPQLTLVRSTDTDGGPATMKVVSVVDGATRAVLPADLVLTGWRTGLTCTPGQPRAAAVLDLATGRELRRIGLLGDCSEKYLRDRRTLSGDLLEPRTNERVRDQDIARVTRPEDGRTWGITLPPTLRGAPNEFPESQVVFTAPDGDGMVAMLPRGNSVLVVRGEPDMGGVLPAPPDGLGLSPDGTDLITTTRAVQVIGRRDRQVRATLPITTLPEPAGLIRTIAADGTVQVVGLSATQWSYSEFTLPDLTLRHRFALDRDGSGRVKKVVLDAAGHRVAVLIEGGFALWDRDTGAVLASGALPKPATDPEAYSRTGVMSLRPGTDEVGLFGPGGLELWNLRTGLLSGTFEAPGGLSPAATYAFDATGNRVATMGLDFSIQVWDVPTRTPIGKLMAQPSIGIIVGFTADGTVVTRRQTEPLTITSPSSIELRDPETGRLVADLRPSNALTTAGTPVIYDGRELLLYGLDGALPTRLPLTVQGWQDSLCRLVDRPFTEAERALLPAGVDDERPCG